MTSVYTEIYRGHPITYFEDPDDPDDDLYYDSSGFNRLSEANQEWVRRWILDSLWPRKAANYARSDSDIWQLAQHQTGVDLSLNQFKDAMLSCGFNPVSYKAAPWHFYVSDASPAFKRRFTMIDWSKP